MEELFSSNVKLSATHLRYSKLLNCYIENKIMCDCDECLPYEYIDAITLTVTFCGDSDECWDKYKALEWKLMTQSMDWTSSLPSRDVMYRVKDACKDDYNNLVQRREDHINTVNAALNALRALNVIINNYVIEYPKYLDVPNDFFELVNCYDWSTAFIKIKCHSGMELYRWLERKNIIQHTGTN